MLFTEQKIDNKFKYKVEDVFGEIELVSEKKLDGETLDDIVFALMRTSGSAKKTVGKISNIDFSFIKRKIWEEEVKK